MPRRTQTLHGAVGRAIHGPPLHAERGLQAANPGPAGKQCDPLGTIGMASTVRVHGAVADRRMAPRLRPVPGHHNPAGVASPAFLAVTLKPLAAS